MITRTKIIPTEICFHLLRLAKELPYSPGGNVLGQMNPSFRQQEEAEVTPGMIGEVLQCLPKGEIASIRMLRTSEGGFLNWHTDSVLKGRRRSLIVLTDLADVGGTEFRIGNETVFLKSVFGLTTLFTPDIVHRGIQVKSGVRFSLRVSYYEDQYRYSDFQ